MKSICLFFVIVSVSINRVDCQNLVLNHDFDSATIDTITGGGSVNNWNHHYPLDYPRTPISAGMHYVPNNPHPNWAYIGCLSIPPKEGSAYIRAQTFARIRQPSAPRPMIIGQLRQSLEKDTVYCGEFYVRPHFNSDFFVSQNLENECKFSVAAGSSIGLWFSDRDSLHVRNFWEDSTIVPHVYNQNGYLTDTTKWTRISNHFIAKGGERFVFVGSFFTEPGLLMFPSYFNQIVNLYDPDWGKLNIDAVYCYKCSDTLFTVNIGRDTLLCPGESVALHAHYEGFKLQDTSVVYSWQTPAGPRADSTVVATTPGYYEVEVVINHRFRARHGVWVHFGPEPPSQDRYLPEAIELCEGHTELLEMPLWDTTTYTWNTGATGNALLVEYPGTYTVVAENFCWDHEETVTVTEKLCDQRLWIPNAFSPDGDGINDYFEIRGNWQTPIALWIFDRWGNVVFHSKDYQNDWDGTYPNGQPAMPGVYTWKITYRNNPTSGERDRHGTVTIVP